MKLFLTSSCISENLASDFLQFLDKSLKDTKFYFIPTATDVEENKFYTAKSLDDIARLGINPVWYSLRFKNKELIREELADADVVWVGGGNTFYLLNIARESGFFEVINDLVRNKGVIYGGTSAGTILASPSIEIAGWGEDADTNHVGLTDLSSLHFIDALFQVHYDSVSHVDMLTMYKTALPIYVLPDGGAVTVKDQEIKLLGGAEAFIS
ncbi:hypothetical protein EXS71_04965 [Candidatus Uhrbacteria bacterium]|nr:hypothetical protein [Candidatus Uhrbacteria bacterium]